MEGIEKNKKYLSFLKIINFILIFIVVLDPTNTIFHLKLVVFSLFCFTAFPLLKPKYYFVPLIFFTLFFLSYALGVITDEKIDNSMAILIIKAFLFLLYLFWVTDNRIKTFEYLYRISLIMALVEIFVYCIFQFSFFDIAKPLYGYISAHDNFIMIGKRNYYGLNVYQVFYKTSPMCVFLLGISLCVFLETKKKKFLLHSIIFALCLFCSGTRANWLAGFMIIVFIYLFYSYFSKKRMLFFTIFTCLGIFISIWVIIFLLTTSETSTNIKQGHLLSYMELFNSNYLKTLFLGFGPGRIFYTSGFGGEYSMTELSFFDLIKNFGCFGTLLISICLLYPMLNLYNNNSLSKLAKFSIAISYIAYLFDAGTNPLLISSTGFMVVCAMFYISDKNLYRELDVYRKNLIKFYCFKYNVKENDNKLC